MPKANPPSLLDLLDARARCFSDRTRQEHAGGDLSDAEMDYYGSDLERLDREILGRPHADAPAVALALRAKVALDYIPLPVDEPGGASEIELAAVRALRSSLRLLATRGGRRPD